uniref:Uncharacterized protein n=1 Tax=Glossina palpalis gambiensis TaxID=67801 RepID=A0A1B0B737_9MUSC
MGLHLWVFIFSTMSSKKHLSFVQSCRQCNESHIYLIKHFLLNVHTPFKFMLNIHFDYDNNYYGYVSRQTSVHDRLPDRKQE